MPVDVQRRGRGLESQPGLHDLHIENGTTGPLMFRSGRSDIEQVLGNYPIVESNLMPAGTALLGDFRETGWLSKDNEIAWNGDGDGDGDDRFTKNQVIFRSEGRYGLVALRPAAFVKATIVSA